MSIIKLELKKEHLILLKHLRWSLDNKKCIIGIEDDENQPFGENNLYDAMDLILNGKDASIDPFTTEEVKEYTPEQKAEWDKLYADLPMALDIILFNGHFELGLYRTKFHDRQWKKIN